MTFLLTEPAIVPAVFCSGFAEPRDLGDGNFLFTGFAEQPSFNDYAGGVEHVIVCRIIMPMPAVILSIQATMKALGIQCCGGERLKLRH